MSRTVASPSSPQPSPATLNTDASRIITIQNLLPQTSSSNPISFHPNTPPSPTPTSAATSSSSSDPPHPPPKPTPITTSSNLAVVSSGFKSRVNSSNHPPP